MEYQDEEEEKLPPGCVVAEKIALADVKEFVDEILDDYIAEAVVNAKYRRIVRAVMLGKIVLTADPLVYILREPITNPDGQVTLTELEFKTRVTAADQQRLVKQSGSKGDGVDFGMRCMAFVINQPVALLNKLSRNDYKFIEEITQVFL